MANELSHIDVGIELTKLEWEGGTTHQFNAQAIGDLLYASSLTQLSRLPIGSTGQLLLVSGGLPVWDNAPILTSPTIQGTVLAGTGLTMPAFTAGGDITIGANKLITTDLLLKQGYSDGFFLRNSGDTADADIYTKAVWFSSAFIGTTNSALIRPSAANGSFLRIFAYDSNVGNVEIGRFISAADPYMQVGRDDSGVALNAVTDMLVLQAGGGTGNEAANFGLGISMKIGNAASQVEERGSLDLVLVTATDGAEDARLDWNLMAGGAMNLAMQLSGLGVLDVDASSGLGAATVGLFDSYDDAILLRQGISERQMGVLESVGVVRKKLGGSGWFLNVQAMLYLLAGGIYQTRERVDELSGRMIRLERALPAGGV